jgi:S1-C subfamily serine protease
MVTDVAAGGPAERAGLAKGDVVLRFAGEAIHGVDDLHRLLTAERAQTELPLEVLRAGRLLTLTVIPQADG